MRDLMRREFQEESLKIGGAFGCHCWLEQSMVRSRRKRMQTTDVSSDITIHLTVNGAPQAITWTFARRCWICCANDST